MEPDESEHERDLGLVRRAVCPGVPRCDTWKSDLTRATV